MRPSESSAIFLVEQSYNPSQLKEDPIASTVLF